MDTPLLQYLRTRRTVPALQLGAPGPDADTLLDILTIAARVPDHGKLAPWRFITYEMQNRATLVGRLEAMASRLTDGIERDKRMQKVAIFAATPVVVGVVSAPVDNPKIPLWEQQLSAAAVCMNAVHATHGHGFSAQWLTDWFAYDREASALLGLRDDEAVAGFIHMGTPKLPPTERDRPDVNALLSAWTPHQPE
ncbi:MAG: nitroreductase family protein [Alphaproteobacteria bacterium]